jgi:hypothetical protein
MLVPAGNDRVIGVRFFQSSPAAAVDLMIA